VIVHKNLLKKIVYSAIVLAVALAPVAQSAPNSVALKQISLLTKDIAAEGMIVTSKAIITYSNIVGKSADIQLRAIDFTGAQIWAKTIDSGRDEVATVISVDPQGSIWLGGNSAPAVAAESETVVSGAVNPDSVTIENPAPLRGDMTNISLWQFSVSGELLSQIDSKSTQPALVDAISVHSSGASILLSRESGQSFAQVQAGVFGKEIRIGTAKSKFNVIHRASDGTTSLFGSSSETLGGKKLAGKVDGILLKVSKSGAISNVVRSSASGATRDWQSATASNFLTGFVKSGNKTETAITKFNSTFAPTWTTRYPSSGSSLAATGSKGSVFAIFEATTALKGVTGWKAKKGQSVALEFDSKGKLISAFSDALLKNPLAAGFSAEGGLIVLTSSGEILRSANR
jgi:hypothetical protein